ncbi:YdiU family protein [Sporosarcina sp. FSL W7-1349]|uniref:protein adenylyltransferase SelO n=1 Tax=Sporosarcina sp. FSL W7-1349 TaxID=2921561 RepID=UPI0030FABAD9
MGTNKVGWNFDNSYSRLPESFYTKIEPVPVNSPELVILNDALAESLGLDLAALRGEGTAIFAGNQVLEGAIPLAQAYAGHQFGHFNRLGDGRAVLLGEQSTPSGDRFDIQLKGSGRTPYSRGGDGRAALGPMLREYIISEAMQALGIPTTRSLAVVTTGEPVYRETVLTGAILTRVASSHLRVGTFQYVAAWGTDEDLQILADYAIERHYPAIRSAANPYLALLEEVMKRQAKLISQWQLVGFIHGVMNTDNMTISGETIDYGPCAFMDTYDPKTVYSSIDVQGRYAYRNQPPIAAWNLSRFAEALLPLIDEDTEQAIEMAQEVISGFASLYQSEWLAGMRAKLGIRNEEEGDRTLFEALLDMMEEHEADFTNTFRALTFGTFEGSSLFQSSEFTEWHGNWQERLSRQPEGKDDSFKLMKDSNPAVIPRNHRVEAALSAAEQGDLSVMRRLLGILSTPYAHSPEQKEFANLPPRTMVPYQTFCGT